MLQLQNSSPFQQVIWHVTDPIPIWLFLIMALIMVSKLGLKESIFHVYTAYYFLCNDFK